MSADLDRLEALAREATPGPWTEVGRGGLRMDRGRDAHEVIGAHDGTRWPRVANCQEGNRNGRENAAYIAAADPSTMLALIARLREAEDAMNVCARCGEAIDAEVAAERAREQS